MISKQIKRIRFVFPYAKTIVLLVFYLVLFDFLFAQKQLMIFSVCYDVVESGTHEAALFIFMEIAKLLWIVEKIVLKFSINTFFCLHAAPNWIFKVWIDETKEKHEPAQKNAILVRTKMICTFQQEIGFIEMIL